MKRRTAQQQERRSISTSVLRGHRHTQALTLIEIVVAVLLISGALMAIIQAFTASATINTRSDNRTEAATAITNVLDETRRLNVTTLPLSGSVDRAVMVGRHPYTVRLTYCAVTTYCTTSSRMIRASALSNGVELNWVETIFTNANDSSRATP